MIDDPARHIAWLIESHLQLLDPDDGVTRAGMDGMMACVRVETPDGRVFLVEVNEEDRD